jgi:hypothetical protein
MHILFELFAPTSGNPEALGLVWLLEIVDITPIRWRWLLFGLLFKVRPGSIGE